MKVAATVSMSLPCSTSFCIARNWSSGCNGSRWTFSASESSSADTTSSSRTMQGTGRSEEHTSELQSLMRTSYAVFCLKKKKINTEYSNQHQTSTNKIMHTT